MGRYFRSRGPFSVPRSPQGHPVLIQAGQSGRGQVFAAKWAEIVFVIHHSLEDAKREYASFKAAVAAAGRDPARVHVAPACYVCVGETETVAQEKTRGHRGDGAGCGCTGPALGSAESSMPGAYDDVVRLLVPELQRRGLFQQDYVGPTLRDNLGLAIPRAADWHAARRAPVR